MSDQKLKAVIVEDEKLARERLKKLLSSYSDFIHIIGEASDGEEGLTLINALKPDLIFLDIQMPLMDGFEMLKHLSQDTRIIFTTAYDQYAIKAFEQNSIDYLLKPIEKSRLDLSIQKLKKLDLINQSDENKQLKLLLEKLNTKKLETITVNIGNKMVLIKVEDIVYFHAEDKYVFINDLKGKKYLLSTSLVELEKKLGSSFIRIHRGYIINKDHILEIRKTLNGKLSFSMAGKNDTSIISSHSYTPEIRKEFQL